MGRLTDGQTEESATRKAAPEPTEKTPRNVVHTSEEKVESTGLGWEEGKSSEHFSNITN